MLDEIFNEKFFIEFCKVEFLCYQGDPNWLGAILLYIPILAIICLVFFTFSTGIIVSFIKNEEKIYKILESLYNFVVRLNKYRIRFFKYIFSFFK